LRKRRIAEQFEEEQSRPVEEEKNCAEQFVEDQIYKTE
jgi:hypothetical protein